MNCPRCDSTNIIGNGFTNAGTNRKRCKDCGKSFSINPRRRGGKPKGDKAMSPAERMKALRARRKAQN